jgi:hypothetical protein
VKGDDCRGAAHFTGLSLKDATPADLLVHQAAVHLKTADGRDARGTN